MNDTISRQAALDIYDDYNVAVENGELGAYRIHRKRLLELPPVQQWILCSEKMPEEHEWLGTKQLGTTISNEVYVTLETPDGDRFATHINFQNGKLSRADEQRMKVWYKGAKPIAWMPLPETYKG